MPSELEQTIEELQIAWKASCEENDRRLAAIESGNYTHGERLQKTVAESTARFDEIGKHIDELEVKYKRLVLPHPGNPDTLVTAELNNLANFSRWGKIDAEHDFRRTQFAADPLLRGQDPSAGYLTSVSMWGSLIRSAVEFTPMRNLVETRPVYGSSMSIPKRTELLSARRPGEAVSLTTTEAGLQQYAFESVRMERMTATAYVSQELLNSGTDTDIEAELRRDMSMQFGVREGREFVEGSGPKEAEGFLNAPGTGQRNLGHASLLTADGIIDMAYRGLQTTYARMATWLMRRSTIGDVRKLKGTDGHYLLTPGIAGVTPMMLLGMPLEESINMPAVAAGAKALALGAWKMCYSWGDLQRLHIIRDELTLSEQALIKFVAHAYNGGQVTLAEGICIGTVSV